MTTMHADWLMYDSSSSLSPPGALRRRWWIVAFLFGLAGASMGLLLALAWHPVRAMQWSLGAAGALLYVLGFTRAHLGLNRRLSDGSVLYRLGVGNVLTLGRGLLLGLLAGFVVVPVPSGGWALVPGVLYTVASFTDLLDGRLARRRGEATTLGARLDVEVDSVGVLLASILAVKFGQLPAVFLAMGGLFYGYRLVLWGRRQRGKPVHVPPEGVWRSRIGGVQVGLFCVILWPVFAPPLTTWAGAAIAIPVLFSFLHDGLVATGRIQPDSAAYRRVMKALRRGLLDRLPLLLRVVVAASGGYFLFNSGALAAATHLRPVLVVLMAVGVVAVAAGAGGRVAAFGLLAVGAFTVFATGSDVALAPVVLGALVLLLTGTGPYSLQSDALI